MSARMALARVTAVQAGPLVSGLRTAGKAARAAARSASARERRTAVGGMGRPWASACSANATLPMSRSTSAWSGRTNRYAPARRSRPAEIASTAASVHGTRTAGLLEASGRARRGASTSASPRSGAVDDRGRQPRPRAEVAAIGDDADDRDRPAPSSSRVDLEAGDAVKPDDDGGRAIGGDRVRSPGSRQALVLERDGAALVSTRSKMWSTGTMSPSTSAARPRPASRSSVASMAPTAARIGWLARMTRSKPAAVQLFRRERREERRHRDERARIPRPCHHAGSPRSRPGSCPGSG